MNQSNKIICGYLENWIGEEKWFTYSNGVIFSLMAAYTHIFYFPIVLKPAVNADTSDPTPGNVDGPTTWDGKFYFDGSDVVVDTSSKVVASSGNYLAQMKYMSLVTKKMGKKFIITLGGWSDMEDTPQFTQDSSDKYANLIVNHLFALTEYIDFDGLDFDWEHLSQFYYPYNNWDTNIKPQPKLETVVDRCLFLGRVIRLVKEKWRQNLNKDILVFYTTRPNTFIGFNSSQNPNSTDREGIVVAAGVLYDGKSSRQDLLNKYKNIKLDYKVKDDINWGQVFKYISYVNLMAYDLAKGDNCGVPNGSKDTNCIQEFIQQDWLPISGFTRTADPYDRKNYGSGYTTTELTQILKLTANKIKNSSVLIIGFEPIWQSSGPNVTQSSDDNPQGSYFSSWWEMNEVLVETNPLKLGSKYKIKTWDGVNTSNLKDKLHELLRAIDQYVGGYMLWAINDIRDAKHARGPATTYNMSFDIISKANMSYWMARTISKILNINVPIDSTCQLSDSNPEHFCKYDLYQCIANDSSKPPVCTVVSGLMNVDTKLNSIKNLFVENTCDGGCKSSPPNKYFCSGSTCNTIGSSCPISTPNEKCFDTSTCGSGCNIVKNKYFCDPNKGNMCSSQGTTCPDNVPENKCFDTNTCNDECGTKPPVECQWWQVKNTSTGLCESPSCATEIEMFQNSKKKKAISWIFFVLCCIGFIGVLFFKRLIQIPILIGLLALFFIGAVVSFSFAIPKISTTPESNIYSRTYYECTSDSKCSISSTCTTESPGCFLDKTCGGSNCKKEEVQYSRCDPITGTCATNTEPCKNSETGICWQGNTCKNSCQQKFYYCDGTSCKLYNDNCVKSNGSWKTKDGKACYIGDITCGNTDCGATDIKYFECKGEICTPTKECSDKVNNCYTDQSCGKNSNSLGNGCSIIQPTFSYCEDGKCKTTDIDCRSTKPGNCFVNDNCNNQVCLPDPIDPNACKEINKVKKNGQCVPCKCYDNTVQKNKDNTSYCVPCSGDGSLYYSCDSNTGTCNKNCSSLGGSCFETAELCGTYCKKSESGDLKRGDQCASNSTGCSSGLICVPMAADSKYNGNKCQSYNTNWLCRTNENDFIQNCPV